MTSKPRTLTLIPFTLCCGFLLWGFQCMCKTRSVVNINVTILGHFALQCKLQTPIPKNVDFEFIFKNVFVLTNYIKTLGV